MPKKRRPEFFVVEGAGNFPFDMLRYDACWPALESESPKLYPSHDERRRVALAQETDAAQAHGATIHRWESFAWQVVATAENAHDAARLARAKEAAAR